jgi:hypothetical protein
MIHPLLPFPPADAADAGAAFLQGIASAPLYDSACGAVVGVISASDFIHTLRRLRNAVSSGSNPLSEAEMDAHTVRGACWHSLHAGGGCVCLFPARVLLLVHGEARMPDCSGMAARQAVTRQSLAAGLLCLLLHNH